MTEWRGVAGMGVVSMDAMEGMDGCTGNWESVGGPASGSGYCTLLRVCVHGL